MDAYGALRYLMTRADFVSRGVMFRAAITQYPGCGIESNNPALDISNLRTGLR